MKRLSPLLKMTLALVALCGMLVVLADLFFGVLPDRGTHTRDLRKNVAEALAVQVAALLEGDDQRALKRTLTQVAERNENVLSLGIRRTDGKLIIQAGDHQKAWRSVEDDKSKADQVSVELKTGGQLWGTFEIAFRSKSGNLVWRWLTEPMVITLLFVSSAGVLVFSLYMRRALQHLDPSSVIPERVQGAFDAMAEGVVVLDPSGRVVLANKSFRNLHTDAGALRLGHSLSLIPWLAGTLPADLSTHAWARAMAERAPNSGQTLEISDGDRGTRRLVVNCAPIIDPGGSIRGCMATFNDISELYRANQALLATLNELSLAKDEVQLKNEELKRLATRDPMTGCLNRRAFNEEFESMFQRARRGNQPLACVMLDIDHFKKVNDNFGHAVGDRVIQEVAKILHDSSRLGDLVCRYGGEEFCLVVPSLDLTQAIAFAERVRVKVEKECALALHDIEGLHVAISLGVDVLSSQVLHPAALIDRADQGLYLAKRSGRNRVCAFAPDRAELQPEDAINRDALIGCLNRRGLEAALETALQQLSSGDGVVGGMIVGVDGMRALHDTHGDDLCNRILQQMAGELQRLVGRGDSVARFGPEEFAVLAPGLGLGELSTLAEVLRVQIPALATAGIPGTENVRITLSLGVDALAAASTGAFTLFDRAELARLRARRRGGNQVCKFAPDRTNAALPRLEVHSS